MEFMTSIYYTLSTIAQVLAGFIALSGVFVLFKLQELDRFLLNRAKDFNYFMKLNTNNPTDKKFAYCKDVAFRIDKLLECASTAGLIDLINTILSNNNTNELVGYENIRLLARAIAKIARRKRFIKLLTIFSIIVGVAAIIYSIIILSFTHQICEPDSKTFMLIGVISASISIVAMTFGLMCSLIDYKILITNNTKTSVNIFSKISRFVSKTFSKKQ